MENEIYYAIVIPAADSPDGETPTAIHVCQEANSVVVWLHSYDGGLEFLKHFQFSKNVAIEWAVDEARRRRAQVQQVQAA